MIIYNNKLEYNNTNKLESNDNKYENIPNDFDWKVYIELNEDLYNMTELEAKTHYEIYGFYEKRLYKLDYIFDIFIYCGAKCGGSTLSKTFINNSYKTLHLHTSLFTNINLLNKYISQNKNNIFDIINNNKQNKYVYIIDSYRNPIERKISSLFQNIEQLIQDYKNKTVIELINIFNEQYLFIIEEYHSINEVFENYKISKFDKFNFDKKYNYMKHENMILIKLRFKDIEEWGDILSEIFNKPINIYSENISDNKDYNNLYKEFKKYYKVSKIYIEKCLINNIENIDTYREFKIYNNDEEQKEYINEWLNKSY